MSKHTYIVSSSPDNWGDGDEYTNGAKATESARAIEGCVTEITWEFDDSELVEDFRQELVYITSASGPYAWKAGGDCYYPYTPDGEDAAAKFGAQLSKENAPGVYTVHSILLEDALEYELQDSSDPTFNIGDRVTNSCGEPGKVLGEHEGSIIIKYDGADCPTDMNPEDLTHIEEEIS